MPHLDTPSGKLNYVEFSSKPDSDTILCIHGFCTDSRIFGYIGKKLAEAGYKVVCVDLPGHGSSNGPRGDLDFEKCVESIKQIVSMLKNRSRVFIMAHSTGSTFAMWYAHLFKNSVDGLIILSPYVRIRKIKKRSDAEPTTQQFLYLLLRRIFTPQKTADITKAFPNYVKACGEDFARVINDYDLNMNYSFRYLIDVMALRNSKVTELADVSDPVLILHGRKDRNVFLPVSEEYLKLLRTDRKDIKIFDCDHWFFNAIFYDQVSEKYTEESRKEVVTSIVEWIRSTKA